MPTNNKTQKESNMLKEILSISGKPGLFKLINNTANALIVESLLDGKRFPAYSNAKIIALEDISIYTEDEDMPLKTVFKRMYEKENIEVLMEYIPLRINGERKVTSLVVQDKKDGKEIELAVDGVFVEAGGIPNNSYLPKDVITNSLGEIITDKEGKTNIPGLFAAGDVTDGKNKQVIIAAGEGAAAALAAHDYLLRN